MKNFDFQTDMDSLLSAFLSLKKPEEVKNFLRDICTLAELRLMNERWNIVLELQNGTSYRKIAEKLGTSTTTVTRCAQWLEHGMGGYKLALQRLKNKN